MNKPTVKTISVAEDRKVTVVLEYASLLDVPEEQKILLLGAYPDTYCELSWKINQPRLCLSVRAINVLHSIGVTTLEELINYNEIALIRCPGLGPRVLNEIKMMMARFNLNFKRYSSANQE